MGRTGGGGDKDEGREGGRERDFLVKKWMRRRGYAYKFHMNDQIQKTYTQDGKTEKSSAVATTTESGHAGWKDDGALKFLPLKS
jgi:hypothetical protein